MKTEAQATITSYLRDLLIATETEAIEMSPAEIAAEVKRHFPASAISASYVSKSRSALRAAMKKTAQR